MKILREGPAWEHQIECEKCKSLLAVNERDLYSRDVGSDRECVVRIFFNCLYCTEPNMVADQYLSPFARTLAYAATQQGK